MYLSMCFILFSLLKKVIFYNVNLHYNLFTKHINVKFHACLYDMFNTNYNKFTFNLNLCEKGKSICWQLRKWNNIPLCSFFHNINMS